MYRMMKLEADMAAVFKRKYGYPESLSVFGACDERGFLAFCYYDETKDPAEIVGFTVIDKTEEEYWVENLVRAVINALELSGKLYCVYKGDAYARRFIACRFKDEDGVKKADLKKIFSSGGHCHD